MRLTGSPELQAQKKAVLSYKSLCVQVFPRPFSCARFVMTVPKTHTCSSPRSGHDDDRNSLILETGD